MSDLPPPDDQSAVLKPLGELRGRSASDPTSTRPKPGAAGSGAAAFSQNVGRAGSERSVSGGTQERVGSTARIRELLQNVEDGDKRTSADKRVTGHNDWDWLIGVVGKIKAMSKPTPAPRGLPTSIGRLGTRAGGGTAPGEGARRMGTTPIKPEPNPAHDTRTITGSLASPTMPGTQRESPRRRKGLFHGVRSPGGSSSGGAELEGLDRSKQLVGLKASAGAVVGAGLSGSVSSSLRASVSHAVAERDLAAKTSELRAAMAAAPSPVSTTSTSTRPDPTVAAPAPSDAKPKKDLSSFRVSDADNARLERAAAVVPPSDADRSTYRVSDAADAKLRAFVDAKEKRDQTAAAVEAERTPTRSRADSLGAGALVPRDMPLPGAWRRHTLTAPGGGRERNRANTKRMLEDERDKGQRKAERAEATLDAVPSRTSRGRAASASPAISLDRTPRPSAAPTGDAVAPTTPPVATPTGLRGTFFGGAAGLVAGATQALSSKGLLRRKKPQDAGSVAPDTRQAATDAARDFMIAARSAQESLDETARLADGIEQQLDDFENQAERARSSARETAADVASDIEKSTKATQQTVATAESDSTAMLKDHAARSSSQTKQLETTKQERASVASDIDALEREAEVAMARSKRAAELLDVARAAPGPPSQNAPLFDRLKTDLKTTVTSTLATVGLRRANAPIVPTAAPMLDADRSGQMVAQQGYAAARRSADVHLARARLRGEDDDVGSMQAAGVGGDRALMKLLEAMARGDSGSKGRGQGGLRGSGRTSSGPKSMRSSTSGRLPIDALLRDVKRAQLSGGGSMVGRDFHAGSFMPTVTGAAAPTGLAADQRRRQRAAELQRQRDLAVQRAIVEEQTEEHAATKARQERLPEIERLQAKQKRGRLLPRVKQELGSVVMPLFKARAPKADEATQQRAADLRTQVDTTGQSLAQSGYELARMQATGARGPGSVGTDGYMVAGPTISAVGSSGRSTSGGLTTTMPSKTSAKPRKKQRPKSLPGELQAEDLANAFKNPSSGDSSRLLAALDLAPGAIAKSPAPEGRRDDEWIETEERLGERAELSPEDVSDRTDEIVRSVEERVLEELDRRGLLGRGDLW